MQMGSWKLCHLNLFRLIRHSPLVTLSSSPLRVFWTSPHAYLDPQDEQDKKKNLAIKTDIRNKKWNLGTHWPKKQSRKRRDEADPDAPGAVGTDWDGYLRRENQQYRQANEKARQWRRHLLGNRLNFIAGLANNLPRPPSPFILPPSLMYTENSASCRWLTEGNVYIYIYINDSDMGVKGKKWLLLYVVFIFFLMSPFSSLVLVC